MVQPKAPTPGVPEIFPGFQVTTETEKQRGLKAATQQQVLAEQRNQLLKKLSETPTQDEKVLSRLMLNPESLLGMGVTGEAEQQKQAEEQRKLLEQQSRDLGIAIDAEIANIRSSDWRLAVLNLAPALGLDKEAKLGIKSIDDLMKLSDTYTPTVDDRTFAEDIMRRVGEVSGTVDVSPQVTPNMDSVDVAGLVKTLRQPGGNAAKLFNVNTGSYSTAELIRLVGATNRYQLPQGITAEEARQSLQHYGLNPAEAEKELGGYLDELRNYVDSYRQQEAKMQLIQADSGRDLESDIRRARWLQAASQPLSLLMTPFEYYSAHIVRPIAGVTFGKAFGDEQFDATLNAAKLSGENTWMAYGKAYEDWDTNWALRFVMETAADPLTYLSFGLITKPLKAIPLIGRPLGVAIDGYNLATEVPFYAARQLWVDTVPKTVAQLGRQQGLQAWRNTKNFVEAVFQKPIRRITPDEMRRAVHSAVDATLLNPQSPDSATSIGRLLLGNHYISPDDIRDLYRRTGALGREITPAVIDKVNTLENLAAGSGFSVFLRPAGAVDEILAGLDIALSPENRKAVTSWMDSVRSTRVRAAKNLVSGVTTRDILNDVLTGVRDNYIKNTETAIAGRRLQQGAVAAMLQGVDNKLRVQAMSWLDRYISTPFARAYLLFSFYAPMNVLEIAVKSSLSGITPWWRGNPYNRNASLFFNIQGNLPTHFIFESKFDPNIRIPEEAIKAQAVGDFTEQSQRAAAYGETKDWFTRIVTGRWVKIFGKDLQDLMGYNLSTVINDAQRASYGGKMYKKQLTRIAPKAADAVTELTRQVVPDLNNFMRKDWADAFRQEFADRVLTGDKNYVKQIVNDFSPEHIDASEVQKLLNEAPNIYAEVAPILFSRIRNGQLWAGGQAGIDDLFETTLKESLYQRYFQSPQMYADRVKEIAESIIAIQPKTIDELNFVLNSIDQMVDTFGEHVSQVLQAAQQYGQRLTDPIKKNAYYKQLWEDIILPGMQRSETELDTLIKHWMDNMPVEATIQGMTTGQREAYLQLLKDHAQTVALSRQAREAQHDIERMFFERSGTRYKAVGHRDNQWWQELYFERNKVWEGYQTKLGLVKNTVFGQESRAPGLLTPRLTDVGARAINAADIAKVFGIPPAELAHTLFIPELIAMRGEKSFIATVKKRVALAAEGLGMSPARLGYTDAAIKRVYDQLTYSIKYEAMKGGNLAPNFLELENLRQALTLYGQTKGQILNEEAMQYLEQQVSGHLRRTVRQRTESELISLGQDQPLYTIRQEPFKLPTRYNPVVAPQDTAKYAPATGINTQVVTSTGRPAVVFHGTPNAFEEFDPSTVNPDALYGPGFYFTTDSAIASGYAKSGVTPVSGQGNVRPAVLSITKPFDIDSVVTVADKSALINHAIETASVSPGFKKPTEAEFIADEGANYNNFATNKDLYQMLETFLGNKLEVNKFLESIGYDGITHIGGQITKSPPHRVWIAFNKNQINDGISQLAEAQVDLSSKANEFVFGKARFKLNFESELDNALYNVSRKQGNPDYDAYLQALKTYTGATEGLLNRRARLLQARIRNLARTAPRTQAEITVPQFTYAHELSHKVTGLTPEQAKERGAALFGSEDVSFEQVTSKLDTLLTPEDTTINAAGKSELSRVQQPEWQDVRSRALDETYKRYSIDFPNYDDETAVSNFMKVLMPFWTYEAHRWAWWLPREMVRHPAVGIGLARYQQETPDQGYIPIPGTDLDINPLRGGIFMGGMRRLFQRDYPEFYDQFGGFSEVMDSFSRFGFYPGSVITIPMSLFGAKNGLSQLGEVLPPWAITLHDTLSAIAPESSVSKMFDVIFPDRYRDFLTAQAVASQGHDGEALLRKKFGGDSLTEEEEHQWAAGKRKLSMYDTLITQTGLFRYDPEDKRRLNAAVREVLAKAYGVRPELIDAVRRSGQRIEDILGPLPPETHASLVALDGYERYTGSSVVLGPSAMTDRILLQREFWDLVQTEKRRQRDVLREQEQRLKAREITFTQWKQANLESNRALTIYIQQLHGDELNPTKYTGVPVTLEERVAFAEKYKVLQPVLHPLEEIRTAYFSHPVEEKLNPETGLYGPDWDGFFTYRDMTEMALPDDILQRLKQLNQADDTTLQRHQYEINKQYFHPYYKLYDAVLAEFPVGEQTLIKRYSAIKDISERDRLAQTVSQAPESAGRTTVSLFNDRLRTARENMREADPELDAWLAVYEEVTSTRSPEAAELYKTYQSQLYNMLP